jgi:RNA polymerase sigma-70 factor (sigma-E family)
MDTVVSSDCEEYIRARLPQLMKFARALTLDEHAAADLVQDSLEKLILKWPRLTGDHDAYVRRIMVNQRVSSWRKVRRERVTDRLPETAVPEAEIDHELLDAMRALPRAQRAVIALRYLDDLTEAETANILGCSVGTVKSHSARAMATLRTSLEGVRA